MGSTSSIPANDGYMKTNPYPGQKKEQPFLYQQNYGGLTRKILVQRSRSYINDTKGQREYCDSGLVDQETAEMKDVS